MKNSLNDLGLSRLAGRLSACQMSKSLRDWPLEGVIFFPTDNIPSDRLEKEQFSCCRLPTTTGIPFSAISNRIHPSWHPHSHVRRSPLSLGTGSPSDCVGRRKSLPWFARNVSVPLDLYGYIQRNMKFFGKPYNGSREILISIDLIRVLSNGT